MNQTLLAMEAFQFLLVKSVSSLGELAESGCHPVPSVDWWNVGVVYIFNNTLICIIWHYLSYSFFGIISIWQKLGAHAPSDEWQNQGAPVPSHDWQNLGAPSNKWRNLVTTPQKAYIPSNVLNASPINQAYSPYTSHDFIFTQLPHSYYFTTCILVLKCTNNGVFFEEIQDLHFPRKGGILALTSVNLEKNGLIVMSSVLPWKKELI